jgi:hypothetical protein
MYNPSPPHAHTEAIFSSQFGEKVILPLDSVPPRCGLSLRASSQQTHVLSILLQLSDRSSRQNWRSTVTVERVSTNT